VLEEISFIILKPIIGQTKKRFKKNEKSDLKFTFDVKDQLVPHWCRWMGQDLKLTHFSRDPLTMLSLSSTDDCRIPHLMNFSFFFWIFKIWKINFWKKE
jgi:hypothetical protein